MSCRNLVRIIIDGGSKDGSKELIEQNQSKISWWCSEPDKGIYNAMNKGIAHAHGDYCLFLNSGDYFYDKCVLEEVCVQRYSSDLVYGDIIDNNTGKPKGNFKGEHITLADFFYSLFPHQATLIRRELFTKWGGMMKDIKSFLIGSSLWRWLYNMMFQ